MREAKGEQVMAEYIPFKTAMEFIKAYKSVEVQWLRNEVAFLSGHGMWLRLRDSNETLMILSMRSDGLFMMDTFYTWEMLVKDFLFLNGTPCGKLAESK